MNFSERLDFYNPVGVIRDVMQNHLTELMTLVTMELPQNSGNVTEILHNKLRVLRQVQPLTRSSTLIGQYASYQNDIMHQTGNASDTPTFAATVIHVQNGRWRNVPIILTSGKKLNEKASYIRVVFKNTAFCFDSKSIDCNKVTQVVFYIGGSDLQKPPMIAISKNLPQPRTFSSWVFDELQANVSMFGQPVQDMYQLVPDTAAQQADAYTFLINAILAGHKHCFTDTDNLMAAWDIWSSLLKKLETSTLRIYKGGDKDMDKLNFVCRGNSLHYLEENTEMDETHEVPVRVGESMTMTQIPSEFRGQRLVSDDLDLLISKLAADIYDHAKSTIQERGVFHIAFSGGNSPPKLLHHIATGSLLFPWEHTHIWLVDERCVPLSHESSNFGMIDRHLLQLINIPFANLHPMPVQMYGEPCQESDDGDNVHSATIKHFLPRGDLDYIVLGMGVDGHTASLFPNTTALQKSYNWVTYSTSSQRQVRSNRLTMTFEAINAAHHISVLVTGKRKKDIVHTISAAKTDIHKYPITGIQPNTGNVTWYIDHQALFG